MKSFFVAALAAALVVPAVPANAAPAGGAIRITLNTPSGVPATAVLKGKANLIVAKAPAGTSAVVTRQAPAGGYLVAPSSVTFGGVRYVGRPSQPGIVVRPGRTSAMSIAYVADGGARHLHAAAITTTSVKLAWDGPRRSRYVLRRTIGTRPAAVPSHGTGIPTEGAAATDRRVKPGLRYTYSLFTQVRGRWTGPLVITAGAAPASGAGQATYIAAPTTLLADAADVVSAAPTGNGVQAVLRNQAQPPTLGGAVVLPISAALPGGFLGVADAVSADGRSVHLVAGALSDAFDYYDLSVDSFTAGSAAPGTGGAGGSAPAAIASKLAGPSCLGGSTGGTVSFAPSVSLGGHFSTKVDKYRFLGQDIPTGASVDVGLTAKVTGAASIETSGEFTCGLALPKLFKTIAVTPVPISVSFEPSAQFSVGGGVKVSNLGFSASGGVAAKGSMTIKDGPSFSGKAMLDATPLSPVVSTNGKVGLKLGGELILGPGAGTKEAGVIAGIDGELNVLDASVGPHFTAQDSRFNSCVIASAAMTRSLSLVAKAWLGGWSYNNKITLDALSGSTPYPGSAWDLPKGCKDLQGDQSKDSLLGAGVTKVDDVTVGGTDQWGHVEGFAPGQKTWVLSTGKITDALGEPSTTASTSLSRPGDDELTTLAGHPTFDAASYTVTLKPAGSTLHVKYVFASEEYPEYVGSNFNDVMVVRVNGKNCATVPGAADPVSVNTINDHTNAAHYVDNAQGAAGYQTSMDGLTKPLTCSVPVTMGQPVTVQIAVADTSDHVLDSAVALIDGGIWAD